MTGRRLTIKLDKPLAPGCTLEIDLDFTLHIPEVGQGANAYNGYFGYTSNQLNLGQWLPMLAIRRGGEWITHDVSAIGEQVVVDVADWDVTLKVSDAADKLMIAAPGTLVEQMAEALALHDAERARVHGQPESALSGADGESRRWRQRRTVHLR